MRQMNMDELREGIGLGRAVIEGNLMDMYITKKLLANEGFPEEDLDGFIAQKVREHEERCAAMEDEEFLDKLTEEWERPEADPEGILDLTGQAAEVPEEGDTEATARAMEEELSRLAAIDDPEDPEFIEVNPIAILQGLINVMDMQIGKVIKVKRALALAGVDPDEVAMAIADTAREFDERYMKMSRAEIEEVMFSRMAEIYEIRRSHPQG